MNLSELVCLVLGFCCIHNVMGVLIPSSNDNGLDDIEGYYWRIYRGKVPKDALLGGSDVNGNPTYIGLTVYNSILIPGYINVEEQQMYYEWGNMEHKTKKDFKILCTQHPEQFEWIRTTDEHIERLFNETFVYGGFERNYTIYIGRTNENDEYVIGKVLIIDGKCMGLNTSSNGTFVKATEFEVLNYNPDIPHLREMKKSLRERNLHNASTGFKNEYYLLSTVISAMFLFLR